MVLHRQPEPRSNMAQVNISVKQRQTHRHRQQTFGCQGVCEGLAGGGKDWEFGVSRFKLVYIYSIGNY